MDTAKVFPNGRSQAVRLPKKYQFSADEVYINRIGDMVVLFPKERGWEGFKESLEYFTDDFMAERNQPSQIEERPDM